jgi:hypothetical protein
MARVDGKAVKPLILGIDPDRVPIDCCLGRRVRGVGNGQMVAKGHGQPKSARETYKSTYINNPADDPIGRNIGSRDDFFKRSRVAWYSAITPYTLHSMCALISETLTSATVG